MDVFREGLKCLWVEVGKVDELITTVSLKLNGRPISRGNS